MANKVDEELDMINDNNRNYEYFHPLQHGCEDNWTWSRKHRSQEAVLPEPTRRKGKTKFSDNRVDF